VRNKDLEKQIYSDLSTSRNVDANELKSNGNLLFDNKNSNSNCLQKQSKKKITTSNSLNLKSTTEKLENKQNDSFLSSSANNLSSSSLSLDMPSSSGLITNLLSYLRLKRQQTSTKNKKPKYNEKLFNANNDFNYEPTLTTTKNEKNKVHNKMKLTNNNINNNDSSRTSSTTSTATNHNYFC